MIRAICFDMDGTLLDTEMLWAKAVEQYLNDAGAPVSRESAIDIMYGRSWTDCHALVREQLGSRELALETLKEELRKRFHVLLETSEIRIPNSITLLKALAKDFPVCVVSGSYADDVANGIRIAGIKGDIKFYLGDEHYAPGKPAPACYLHAAERLGVRPEECLVFEDSEEGIHAAKDAGMHCVALAVPGRPKQDTSRADMTLDDLGKFSIDALQEIIGG